MKKITAVLAACAAMSLAIGAAAAQSNSPLTLSRPGGHVAHVFPHYEVAKQLGLVHKKGEGPSAPTAPALLYHGGPVMQPNLRFYVVFWQPATLQDGSATAMSSGYRTVLQNMVSGYFGHPLASIASQYYQGSGGSRKFITGQGTLVATYNDTQPFPTSQCAASLGPNCYTDAQLETEVQRVITNRGWTPGLDAMFVFFISSGEASCFDNSPNFCSTNYYCAYHSYFGASKNIIYSNEPFGDPDHCLGDGTQPNLNAGGPEVDPAATGASHEMSEAITDPNLDAWFAADGSENGDLCAYNYFVNTWLNHTANQYWNGHVFELQTEYNNHHTGGSGFNGYPPECTLIGP